MLECPVGAEGRIRSRHRPFDDAVPVRGDGRTTLGAVLGTDKEMPQLKQFFSMYRASAPNDDLAHAVGSVAEAMLRIDRKGARPIIESAMKDAMTVSGTRTRLESLIAAVPAEKN